MFRLFVCSNAAEYVTVSCVEIHCLSCKGWFLFPWFVCVRVTSFDCFSVTLWTHNWLKIQIFWKHRLKCCDDVRSITVAEWSVSKLQQIQCGAVSVVLVTNNSIVSLVLLGAIHTMYFAFHCTAFLLLFQRLLHMCLLLHLALDATLKSSTWKYF